MQSLKNFRDFTHVEERVKEGGAEVVACMENVSQEDKSADALREEIRRSWVFPKTDLT